MKKGQIIIIFILLLCLIFIPVKADTGFDSSYSSSDSSSSSSSSSFSGFHSSDFSDDGEENIYSLIFNWLMMAYQIGSVIGFIGISIWIFLKQSKTYPINDIPDEYLTIQGIYDKDALKNEFYEDFVDMQEAWMNFNYLTLQSLCTDELFNMYRSQLEGLKLKNEQNVMSDYSLKDCKILAAFNSGEQLVVKVYMVVSFYDYIIDAKTGKVKRGNKDRMITNRYSLTFVMSSSKDEITKCPNCGHELSDSASSKCPYCGTAIVKSSDKFVLSEKKIIKQE